MRTAIKIAAGIVVVATVVMFVAVVRQRRCGEEADREYLSHAGIGE
jgi:hypothetical protein